MSGRLTAVASTVVLTAAVTLGQPPVAEPTVLTLIDDRGEALTGVLTVCTTVGLVQRCADREVVDGTVTVPSFDSLRLEGPEHGPANLLRSSSDGRLQVPRKAAVVISRPADRLTLSAYRADDPTFRRPALRVEVTGSDAVRIPAGSWLLSLVEAGGAPDLHPIEATPGEQVALRYRRRNGWSMLLRTVASATGRPVSDASIELRPAPGYGDASPRRSRSNRDGLAVFSGLRAALAEAVVEHAAFLPGSAAALSATEGSFAVRQIALTTGGTIEATIRVDGEPLAEVPCRLREAASESPEPWRDLVASETDAEGRFRAGPVAAGVYSLAVEPPAGDGTGSALFSTTVVDGETTPLDVDLVRLELSGEVRSAGAPAVGYTVRIGRLTPGSSTRVENVGQAVTDEDGVYRATLWETGEYQLFLYGSDRSPIETDWVWLGRDGGQRDFDLEEHPLSGRIVHADGRPAAGASVILRWNRARVTSFETDAEGRFELTLNGGGSAEVNGYLAGYGQTDTVTVEVPIRGSQAPIVLRLEERRGLSGRVMNRGRPAPGVRVAAYRTSAAPAPVALGEAVSDAGGRFVLPAADGTPVRLFLSGPGCPLTVVETAGPRDDLELSCAPTAANLIVHLESTDGRPGPGEPLTLAGEGRPVPDRVLASHLAALGLPTRPTSGGEWVLPALQAGRWELFATTVSNHSTIAGGQPLGHLASIDLTPGATVEVAIATGE